jgi:Protein of unknown function (DUF3025)
MQSYWKPVSEASLHSNFSGLDLAMRLSKGEDVLVADALNTLSAELDDFGYIFEAQAPDFSGHYEQYIFETRRIPTRNNVHDLFNGLVWLRFPNTKRLLNRLHVSEIEKQQLEKQVIRTSLQNNRTRLRDKLTLWDEGGLIWLSTRRDLTMMLQAKQWQRLFVENRQAVEQHVRCIIFGHAIYEKLLNPYLAITANSHCLWVNEAMLHQVDWGAYGEVDQYLADAIHTTIAQQQVGHINFYPLPVMGIPGWHADNHLPAFYDNEQVFRSGVGQKIRQPID